ncbi:MAG TPA: DUF4124 domain-containing protein [Burkholderiales bacterium]
MQSLLVCAPVIAQSPQSASDALPTDAVFGAHSFWYQPIPEDVPLHANSEGFLADFLRQKKKYTGNVSIAMASWSSPVYTVGTDVPTVRVKQWFCMKEWQQPNSGLAEQFEAVPIPDYAEPAGGSDSEMTVYQPETDTLWEFWKARKVNGQWEACWGGRMQKASKSDGRWHSIYGTTATGLPFIGGQVTAEELRRGEIRHAIGIALVEAESWRIVSWPAKRSDGFNPKQDPNRIPEGLRFRLDPSVDVDALPMHAAGKVIAKAAQKYGFVVWDKAGVIAIRSQNPKTYTAKGQPNPYPELLDGAKTYSLLRGFPWDKLQFLPQDYGKP